MSSFIAKLNLRPQEQRILVVVIAITVVVLSVLLVWPRVGDWAKLQAGIEKSRKTLEGYQAEIAQIPRYEAQLRELEGQGSAVLPEEQVLDLTKTVQSQATASSVTITGTRPSTSNPTTSTNQFFDEQIIAIDVSSDDKQLVDFLVALGSGDSMIRVRDMDLRPDPPQYKLLSRITLVASYQKKPKPAVAAPTRPAPAPTNSPASSPKPLPKKP